VVVPDDGPRGQRYVVTVFNNRFVLTVLMSFVSRTIFISCLQACTRVTSEIKTYCVPTQLIHVPYILPLFYILYFLAIIFHDMYLRPFCKGEEYLSTLFAVGVLFLQLTGLMIARSKLTPAAILIVL
jgi:hypothetical protein